MGDDEADGFVGDFVGERVFDGAEEVKAELGGGLADLFGVDGMDPVGAEGEFAFFDEVSDERDNGGKFSAAELRDFFEGAALLEEFEGFLRRAGGARVPLLAGAFAVGEAAQGVEDGVAVGFALFFADAGDVAEFAEGFGLLTA
jgi:hypothetical protein